MKRSFFMFTFLLAMLLLIGGVYAVTGEYLAKGTMVLPVELTLSKTINNTSVHATETAIAGTALFFCIGFILLILPRQKTDNLLSSMKIGVYDLIIRIKGPYFGVTPLCR